MSIANDAFPVVASGLRIARTRADSLFEYQERSGPDGEPVLAPVISFDATADEIEAIVAAGGAAVMTDGQAARLEAHFS